MIKSLSTQIDPKPLAYIVGLSAKPNCEHLAPETRTGNIIEKVVNRLPFVKIIKTNLVKTPPINQEGKLRYPNSNEMKLGWDELRNEINQEAYPTLLVTLGQQVSSFLRSQMGVQPVKPRLPSDFSFKSYLSQSTSHILSIHHPSFVFVYRRKYIEQYIENVVLSISILILDNYDYFLQHNMNHIRTTTRMVKQAQTKK
jgi:uracil-DNA glycosylase